MDISSILSQFKNAPPFFYSPCGRDMLTEEEILLRTCTGISEMNITTKEMVFRKFWEVSNLKSKDQRSTIEETYCFLAMQKLSREDVNHILKQLMDELKTLFENQDRMLHYPL